MARMGGSVTRSGADVGELIEVEIDGSGTCSGARVGLAPPAPDAEVGFEVGGVCGGPCRGDGRVGECDWMWPAKWPLLLLYCEGGDDP